MKVLGIAGSPRAGGNTDTLLNEVMRGAVSKGAKVRTLFLRDMDISPCHHCDACFEEGVCVIKDDMHKVYKELEAADRIVLASPVQFMGVSAQTKAMIDRGQALWARKYILKRPPLGAKPGEKKGLFVSVGGRNVANMFDAALMIVKSFFVVLDIAYAGELLFPAIDAVGDIKKHPDALKKAFTAGQKLVES